jgi:hypothetical protein
VIVGTSNAVNLTDGLDGLAIMPTVMVAGALGIFAYVVGNAIFARYLGFPNIPGAGELAVICGAIAGGLTPVVQRVSDDVFWATSARWRGRGARHDRRDRAANSAVHHGWRVRHQAS